MLEDKPVEIFFLWSTSLCVIKLKVNIKLVDFSQTQK